MGEQTAQQTTSSITIEASATRVMSVIADFGSYPAWAKGVQVAEVESSDDQGRGARVRFVLDVAPIKDEYTLAYDWTQANQVSWQLVKGNIVRALDGAYLLRPIDDSTTEVTYRLALDVSIPLIGLLKRKGEKMLIDTALKGLKNRVESL
ncbi:MAG: SRPBCC family protein [Nocardioides sp.]